MKNNTDKLYLLELTEVYEKNAESNLSSWIQTLCKYFEENTSPSLAKSEMALIVSYIFFQLLRSLCVLDNVQAKY